MIVKEQETMIAVKNWGCSAIAPLPKGMGELVTCNEQKCKCYRGEKFHQFCHLLSLVKILSANMFFCIKNCIVDMVTFTTLAKLLSLKTHEKCQLYIIMVCVILELLRLHDFLLWSCWNYFGFHNRVCFITQFLLCFVQIWRIQLQCKSSTSHCPIWAQVHRVEYKTSNANSQPPSRNCSFLVGGLQWPTSALWIHTIWGYHLITDIWHPPMAHYHNKWWSEYFNYSCSIQFGVDHRVSAMVNYFLPVATTVCN